MKFGVIEVEKVGGQTIITRADKLIVISRDLVSLIVDQPDGCSRIEGDVLTLQDQTATYVYQLTPHDQWTYTGELIERRENA